MEAGDRISFQEIAEALRRRWRLLVALPLALAAALTAFAHLRAREYEATAVLRANILKRLNYDIPDPWIAQTYGSKIRTAASLIQRIVPSDEIVRKFKLDAAPYNVQADDFWDNIALLKVIVGTELIEISTFTRDQRLSRDIANYIADQGISRSNKHSRSSASRVKEAIRKRLDDAKRRLDDAEGALSKFNRESGLGELRREVRSLLVKRDQLSSLLFESRLNLKDADQLKRREKAFAAELKEIDENLGEKAAEEAKRLSLLDRLKFEHLLAKKSYFDISNDYESAAAAILSADVDLQIVNRAKLLEKAGPQLTLVALLSLVFGFLFAVFAVLFLEFRKKIFALKEADGA